MPGRWSAPAALPGSAVLSAGRPRVADLHVERGGRVHAVFLADADGDGHTDQLVYAALDGRRWSEPQVLDRAPGRSEAPQVSVDGDGGVHVLWYEGRNRARPRLLTDLMHRVRTGERWSDPESLYREPSHSGIRDPYLAASATAGGGVQVLHSRTDHGYAHRVWNGSGWAPARDTGRDGGYVRWDAAHGKAPGFVYVAAHLVPGERSANSDVWYRGRRGEEWDAPARVYGGEGYSYEPRLATDGRGVRHVVWREGASALRSDRLLHSVSADGRAWSPPRDITPAEPGGSLYSVRLVVDAVGVLHLAFARVAEGVGWRHHLMRLDSESWSPAPLPSARPGSAEGGFEVAPDPATGIHAVWKGADGLFRHAVLRR